MNEINIKSIKELILKEFSDTPFTIGDVYYKINKDFNRSLFATIRNIIVKLSKEKFLNYKIAYRGMPHLNSEKKITGAIYKVRK